MPPRRTEAPPRRRQPPPPTAAEKAAVAAAVAALAGTAAPGAAGATGAAGAAAAESALVEAILKLLARFGRRKRSADAALLLGLLEDQFPERPVEERRAIVNRELEFEAEFQRKQRERIERDVRLIARLPTPEARAKRLEEVRRREAHYVRLRQEAMTNRAIAAQEQELLRELSPRGAFWVLSPYVRNHTADCVAMANKFWPWEILERIHPPMHHGCACELYGESEALERGMMTLDAVRDPADAVADARALARDIGELRERLEEASLQEFANVWAETGDRSAAIRAVLLREAFRRDQPRWPKGHPKAGQWRPKVASAGGRRSPAWMRRDLGAIRESIAKMQATPYPLGVPDTKDTQELGAQIMKLAKRYSTADAYRERAVKLAEEREEAKYLFWQAWDRGDDDEIERLEQEKRKAGGDREREILELKRRASEADRDALLGILSELRPMGGASLAMGEVRARGQVAVTSRGQRGPVPTTLSAEETAAERAALEQQLREVSRLLPRDWIRSLNERGVIHWVTDRGERRGRHLRLGTSQWDVASELLRAGWKYLGADGERPVVMDTGGQRWHLNKVRGTWPKDVAMARALVAIESGTELELTRKRFPHKRRGTGGMGVYDSRITMPPMHQPGSTEAVKRQGLILHEVAHRLEEVYDRERGTSPPLLGRMRLFRSERTKGDPLLRLKDVVPGAAYGDHEVTRLDQFVDPYMGREYDSGSTEVLTMGLQMLWYPPTYGPGLDGDPRMRDFIVGVVASA